MPTCVYCSVLPEEAWIVNEDAIAVPHSNPLANCHMVVAPRRHVRTFYDLDVQEQQVVWSMVGEIQKRILSALKVDGFYIGFADGTEEDPIHAHVHVVPRSPGDDLQLPAGIEWVNE